MKDLVLLKVIITSIAVFNKTCREETVNSQVVFYLSASWILFAALWHANWWWCL